MSQNKMTHPQRVSVIGLGYIGLPTAAILAACGYRVDGVDTNIGVIETLRDGVAHIEEPDLAMLVKGAISSQQLQVSSTAEPADIYIVTVPTPLSRDNSPDLSFVESAIDSITPYLQKGNLLILESTCPVGTTQLIAEKIAQQRPDLHFLGSKKEQPDVYIAYCPERVLPGSTMKELIENDRVVGALCGQSAQRAIEFYQSFIRGRCYQTNARTAELCKLAENSFRDVNIAFANELSMLCNKLHVDVWELIKLTNHHPRVNILEPGCGVGGHCIAVDPWFLIHQNPEQSKLMRAAREVNDQKAEWSLSQIELAIGELTVSLGRPIQIACLGITFKADVEDTRESPALQISTQLSLMHPGKVIIVEPHLQELPEQLQKSGARMYPLDEALRESDLIVILIDHSLFKSYIYKTRESQRVLDLKGIWS